MIVDEAIAAACIHAIVQAIIVIVGVAVVAIFAGIDHHVAAALKDTLAIATIAIGPIAIITDLAGGLVDMAVTAHHQRAVVVAARGVHRYAITSIALLSGLVDFPVTAKGGVSARTTLSRLTTGTTAVAADRDGTAPIACGAHLVDVTKARSDVTAGDNQARATKGAY